MSLTLKRRVTVLATVISGLLIAGVVFAAFTANGEGAGSATSFAVGDVNEIDFEAAAADLYPGHTVATTLTVTNTEDFPAVVTDIDLTNVSAITGCDVALVSASLVDELSGETLAASGGDEVYNVEVTMSPDAENPCAGQTFDFDLDVVLASVPDSTTP